MKYLQGITIKLIRLYQKTISPDHGWYRRPTCRFSPTCSEYAIQAIEKNGLFRGILLAIKRLSRCHPFSKKAGFDPIS